MYLSLLKLDTVPRKTRELLINPYTLHQTVYRAFPDRTSGGPGRVLYRIDNDRRTGTVSLLVQSEKEPDWPRADYLNECLSGEAQTKCYAPAISKDQRLHYLLRANPSVKKQGGKRKNGCRLGLIHEEDQIQWLHRKAEQHGFHLVSCRPAAEGIVQNERGQADRIILRHFAVRFEGILEVADPDAFTMALESGIGPAKGFGFGLLSIAPVKG